MSQRLINTICFVLLTFSVTAQRNYSQYVNPFIGTGGHGHTYPGATVPHGMVQLSPDTRLEGWDGCSGYHYSDTFIYGFSHTHLSGTGVSDYGDILVMPMSGTPSPDNKIYGSGFSHENENATAGYYSVLLDDDGIRAEFTTTERTGFHHYTFPSQSNNLIIDLKHRDEVFESGINFIDSVTVTGFRRSKAWAIDQHVYFVIKFSSAVSKKGIWENEVLTEGLKMSASKNIKAYLQFRLPAANELYVKVGISSVSVEGAIKNLNAELPGWDFNDAKVLAKNKWNSELSKVEVESADEDKLKIFYTALYHTAIVPNLNMDVDSMYRGRDNAIHKAEDFTNYSVFSLWDTYRAAHPLYTIIDRKRTLDYIKTFLAQYKEGGRLPVWELASNETDCMIGYHSVPVIVDAYMKGITGFDTELAFEAMKKSSNWSHLGLPAYRSKGMIEVDDEHESVSKTLEYAFDDWCIAMFAARSGNWEDFDEFSKRAQYYKNMLDVKTGFMRPRKNGDWLIPFDPREVNNHFTEANSWQYSFYMPQDISGYIKLLGGNIQLEKKLDSLFTAPAETTGREQSDITGMIGQYAHGNEPSHHISYLYNYTPSPFKTQEIVHRIMKEFYKNSPDGLIGNEDCGQMSAWYVLSALGFYPLTPASNIYMIGTPLFSHAKIHVEYGQSFLINAPKRDDKNYYVQEAVINNPASGIRKLESLYIWETDITYGGSLNFKISDKPSVFLPVQHEPMSNHPLSPIVLNPVIHGGGIPFKDMKIVPITASDNSNIFYTTDGSDPTVNSKKYSSPVLIDRSLTLNAIAIDRNGKQSFITTAVYKKLPHSWSVHLNTPFEKQYDGGGAEGLVDGIRGITDWRKGNWQGYQHADVDIVIDLKKEQLISEVSAGFLQDTRSWIVMPSNVTVEISTDNLKYTKLYDGKNFLPVEELAPQLRTVKATFPSINARYVRLQARQFGTLPSWHEGAGGATHIFIDEIEIK